MEPSYLFSASLSAKLLSFEMGLVGLLTSTHILGDLGRGQVERGHGEDGEGRLGPGGREE